MKIYTLKREQLIRKPVMDVFSFFENPGNLARITPSNLDFKMLTPLPIKMRTGRLIDHTIKIFGLRVHWRTLITDYDPPGSFTDEQLKGPYAFWHHRHEFISTDEGTLIRDTVAYALPFGILGRLAHFILVKKQLESIFNYRFYAIERIFKDNER